jgi:hypothetical protein
MLPSCQFTQFILKSERVFFSKLSLCVVLQTYSLCGWEGAASNARVFADAKAHDFIVPPGKYYLADAGFPVCDELLIPYHAVRYHLAEWGCAGVW